MRYAAKKLTHIAKLSSMIPKIIVTTTYNFLENEKQITYTKTYKALVDNPISTDELLQETIKKFANGEVESSLEVVITPLNNPNDFEM